MKRNWMSRDSLREWLIRAGLDRTAGVARHPILAAQASAARRWSRKSFQPTEALARTIDSKLWDETVAFAAELEAEHRARFEQLRASIRLGGAGDHRLLYFLTRLTRPTVVVETGVAAGWSSAAILAALARNGEGHLWSSELVYDRPWLHDDYRTYVGMVVDDHLRDRWTLLLDGDDANLPSILAECGEVGLFHYDSDKSFAGRTRALRTVEPSLADDAVLVFDDITDDLHFRDLATRSSRTVEVTGTRGTVGLVWDGAASSDRPA